MAVNPADSVIFGTLYGSDAMRAVFDEPRLLPAHAGRRSGAGPGPGAPRHHPRRRRRGDLAAARVENLRADELAASARNVGYPVVGLVAGLSRAAGAAGALDTLGRHDAGHHGHRHGAAGARRAGADPGRTAGHRARRWRRRPSATAHTVMAGRTHLQQALPITFGLKCADLGACR